MYIHKYIHIYIYIYTSIHTHEARRPPTGEAHRGRRVHGHRLAALSVRGSAPGESNYTYDDSSSNHDNDNNDNVTTTTTTTTTTNYY